MGTARYSLAGAGTQTAGLAFGGAPGSIAATEEYDGSSWTAGGTMNNGRSGISGSGTQTAALGIGGGPGGFNGRSTESYDGSTWSITTGTTVTHPGAAAGTASPNTQSIVFAGSFKADTEEFTGGSPAVITASTLTTS